MASSGLRSASSSSCFCLLLLLLVVAVVLVLCVCACESFLCPAGASQGSAEQLNQQQRAFTNWVNRQLKKKHTHVVRAVLCLLAFHTARDEKEGKRDEHGGGRER